MKPIYLFAVIALLLLFLLAGPSLESINAATPTPVPTYALPTERSYSAAELLGTIGPYPISHDYSALPLDMPEKMKGIEIGTSRSFWTWLEILNDAGALGQIILFVLVFIIIPLMFRIIVRMKGETATKDAVSQERKNYNRYLR